MSETVKRSQKRKKELAVERMGGKCSICGYDKCLSALEFHHLDRETKEESPTYVIMRWSWERAKKELEKCILVCSNCHREIHDAECGIELKSVEIKPWITKECPQCKDEFDTKRYDQVYCCRNCYEASTRCQVKPPKHELRRLLNQKVPWVKLGKMFGVSDNAVRKWAKSYELI